jgi:hypothetical protein
MDYKDTLLDNLKSLLHDLISEDKITPGEIYDCIQKTITESYYYHKHYTGRSYELMEKLHNNASYQSSVTYTEMVAKGYEMTADGFWIPPQSKSFTSTIELDPASQECYMTIPPELLEKLNWTEGTQLILTLNNDNTILITKE